MVTQDFRRKLTAILSADVEGYSRLMGEDELTTIETLKKYREVAATLIQEYQGRVVDSPGDNILAEFASVVDAVQCAAEIQKKLKLRNDELPDDRRMEFRMGVNLGDVVEDGERIYGDGVNIAARVESLAHGGGICISGTAYDQIGKKLPLGYEYLDEQAVKNIETPVRVYRVLMDPEAAGKVIGEKRVEPKRGQRAALAAMVALLLVVGGVLIWRAASPPVEVASEENMAFLLPDKPSIAILPFDNLSGDKSKDYFSDGITESIITALSNVSNLFVISRNSTFTYKGKPVKMQQVAEELGVRYVLEGSVQRSEDRVRITAQLNDALTGHHLWAEHYDRKLGDIFALQDDITEHVAMALEVKLTEGEQAQIRRGKTGNPEAYEYFLRGLEVGREFTKEDNAQARKLFEEAVALDPKYAHAWQEIGRMHYRDAKFGWTDTPDQSLELAEELAKKTLAINNSDGFAYGTLSLVYMARRQHEKAISYGEKALALVPNFADVHAAIALPFLYSGRPEEAIELVKKAMRLSPYYPGWYLPVLGHAYRLTGQYKEAIDALENWRARANPRSELPYLMLAFTYVEAAREEEARVAVTEILKRKPKASIEGYAQSKFFAYKDSTEIKRSLDSLRKAGLPETPPLPLPDKPSIAVLAFDNLSDDPKQEYFSDGLTEQIITTLSKLPSLFVIARNSSFTYKGKPVKVKKVSQELGVRYVLEGSVQKSGDRVRITAQLVDAITGHHLWAERYDRDVGDIFALQDEITMKVLTALRVKLTGGEQVRISARNADNIEAYLIFLQAIGHYRKTHQEGNFMARGLCEEAIVLDPNFADLYRLLAWTHLEDVWFGWSKSSRESFKKAVELAEQSLALDGTNAHTVALVGHMSLLKRQHEKAIAEGERSIALDPNSASNYNILATTLRFSGRAAEAIPLLKKAIRLEPYTPSTFYYQLGMAYNFTGHYDEAIAVLKKALKRTPDHLLSLLGLTIAYSLADRMEEARATAAEVLRVNPKLSVAYLEKKAPYKHKADLELSMGAMRKAGLK